MGAQDRPKVRWKVSFLSEEARLRRKLAAFKEELARLKREGGAPEWVVRWYEEAIRRTEEELRALASSSSSSSRSRTSPSSSGSGSRGMDKR